MKSKFLPYIKNGWILVPLVPGEKLPKHRGWNREALCLFSEDDVDGVEAAGLAHAYSGTCAIDIDDVTKATEYLANHDIDLQALLDAPDAVKITSGRPNRLKLLYALDSPLPSVKVIEGQANIVDFRSATRTGYSVQDALPPSIHPVTSKPYRWEYNNELVANWRSPPRLPESLLALWEDEIVATKSDPAKLRDGDYTAEDIRPMLECLDPDSDYNEWIRIGMAIHAGTGGSDEGLGLWDEWSAKGGKYEGKRDLVGHWGSFRNDGISVDYLKMQQVASADDFEVLGEADDPKEPNPKQKALERFQPVHIGEWVKRPPPTWLVEEVLPESDLAMVFGASGSGKSFWVMDVAMHVAAGRPWRERDTVAGPVLWVAAEAAGSVRNRALAHARHYEVDLPEIPLWIIGDTPILTDVAHVRALATHAKPLNPRLIVIDTMNAASGGANENSGEDMGTVLAACRTLHRITGALVLLIHHAGKDASKGARGWSGIKGAMQTEIEVTHGDTGERKARIAKQRDGEEDIEFPFRLVPVLLNPFDGKPQHSCAVEGVDGVQLVDEKLHPGWAALSLSIFLQLGAESWPREAYLATLKALAVNAGAEDLEIDNYAEQLLKDLADSGSGMVGDTVNWIPFEFDDEDLI